MKGTVVSLIREASQKAQMIHNAEVQAVETEKVSADEMWSFALKKQKNCQAAEVTAGDCWIWLSLAKDNGLILAARVGKRTDVFMEELLVSTEGKTECDIWNTDGWGGYQRVLSKEINHQVGKRKTQRKRKNQWNSKTANGEVASACISSLAKFGSKRK